MQVAIRPVALDIIQSRKRGRPTLNELSHLRTLYQQKGKPPSLDTDMRLTRIEDRLASMVNLQQEHESKINLITHAIAWR